MNSDCSRGYVRGAAHFVSSRLVSSRLAGLFAEMRRRRLGAAPAVRPVPSRPIPSHPIPSHLISFPLLSSPLFSSFTLVGGRLVLVGVGVRRARDIRLSGAVPAPRRAAPYVGTFARANPSNRQYSARRSLSFTQALRAIAAET